jgi:hypothetical protein
LSGEVGDIYSANILIQTVSFMGELHDRLVASALDPKGRGSSNNDHEQLAHH